MRPSNPPVAEWHRRAVPSAQFTYIDVTFGTADTDLVVQHDLQPDDPESVGYQVVRRDRACEVYDDQSSTRRAWTKSSIVLRCDTADAVVRLLLTVPQDNS
jgi:hypothetical protein